MGVLLPRPTESQLGKIAMSHPIAMSQAHASMRTAQLLVVFPIALSCDFNNTCVN
jgi:hypothetical protein